MIVGWSAPTRGVNTQIDLLFDSAPAPTDVRISGSPCKCRATPDTRTGSHCSGVDRKAGHSLPVRASKIAGCAVVYHAVG